jgi:hypothetical protein
VKARPAEGVARGEDARDAARHALAALLEGGAPRRSIGSARA